MSKNYKYYVVENSFVVRVNKGTIERYTPNGNWESYSDRWDVFTNGKLLESHEDPIQVARELFEDEKLD